LKLDILIDVILIWPRGRLG